MDSEAMTVATDTRRAVWTVGHGDRDFDDLARTLAVHGVRTIVDVRSEPYSRFAPDFTKGELEVAAASAGFGYRWLGDRLGGRPLPTASQLESGLGELAGLADAGEVVLLCAEADPANCHRNTHLAPALVARGYHVVHILGDGAATPYQEPLLDA